jgi:hypothetical protein
MLNTAMIFYDDCSTHQDLAEKLLENTLYPPEERGGTCFQVYAEKYRQTWLKFGIDLLSDCPA